MIETKSIENGDYVTISTGKYAGMQGTVVDLRYNYNSTKQFVIKVEGPLVCVEANEDECVKSETPRLTSNRKYRSLEKNETTMSRYWDRVFQQLAILALGFIFGSAITAVSPFGLIIFAVTGFSIWAMHLYADAEHKALLES